MSGFDLRAIVGELSQYVGAYVKKSYMPHYEQIVLRINPKESNQFDLVVVRGSRVYTSNRDRPMPQTPPPFAMVLRKYLKNARMTAVRQLGFDRVLAFGGDWGEFPIGIAGGAGFLRARKVNFADRTRSCLRALDRDRLGRLALLRLRWLLWRDLTKGAHLLRARDRCPWRDHGRAPRAKQSVA